MLVSGMSDVLLKSPIDDLLRPFEARLPDAALAKREQRQTKIELGRNLNRIQDFHPDATSSRLSALYVSGRIDADEYRDLAVKIARCGLDAPDSED